MPPYQRRIILSLLGVLLIGLMLKVIDRQRQAVGFDIRGFLDGYKHTSAIDTAKTAVKAQTNVLNYPVSSAISNTATHESPKRININSADIGELQMLPGIGPLLAQKIIAFRDSIGTFNDADDLLKVRGIGHKNLQRIKPYLEF